MISPNKVFAWTDSIVVLSWLVGNPRRFDTFVGNQVSTIMELTSPDQWRHVSEAHNSADCASCGLFPSELLQHELWWSGPKWLHAHEAEWPSKPMLVGPNP